ncbi:Dihydroxyacetone kinase 2, partial [Spiromyces aspiralis]
MTDGKHFINDPTELVLESLKGLTLTYSHLALDEKQKVVYAKNTSQLRETQVTLMSGGGAGHEPAHSGYVGPGMLTAAVSGHVFASPTSSQVLSCLRRIYSPEHGTLVIVKNYTGDILNFGRAIERFKAERVSRNNEHDPKVEMVVVGDDVGVVGEESEDVGRRGLAATILVHKVAGALAAIGAPLDEVKSTAEFVCANAFTVGCALEAASVPAAGKPRHLGADQIEVGMGIHNEPGFRTTRIASARSLVSSIVDRIVSSRFLQRLPDLSERRDVVILVNNLGAVSNLEMGLVAKEAIEAV